MRKRPKLSYANVTATLALFIALGGGAMAASHLGKNSVGTKQLKKNAVTTNKIKKNAVTGAKIKKQTITAAKVKNATLTGTQINASTLGTVPTAQQANSLAPAEGWHEVGAPGEPGFENSWHSGPPPFETAAFYKDHDGVVHLRGLVTGGTANPAFLLPPGYRPASGHGFFVPEVCGGGPCGVIGVFAGAVDGPGVPAVPAGAVQAPAGATSFILNGITFRAES
jgi:hypothetical protein